MVLGAHVDWLFSSRSRGDENQCQEQHKTLNRAASESYLVFWVESLIVNEPPTTYLRRLEVLSM